MNKKYRKFRRRDFIIPAICGGAITISPLLVLLVHSCHQVTPVPEPVVETVNVILDGNASQYVEIDKTVAIKNQQFVCTVKLMDKHIARYFLDDVVVTVNGKVIDAFYSFSSNTLKLETEQVVGDIHISITLNTISSIPTDPDPYQDLTYLTFEDQTTSKTTLTGIHKGIDFDQYNTLLIPSSVKTITANAFDGELKGDDCKISRIRFSVPDDNESKIAIQEKAFNDCENIDVVDTLQCKNLGQIYGGWANNAFSGLKDNGTVLYNYGANDTDKYITANFLHIAGINFNWVYPILTPRIIPESYLNIKDATLYGFNSDVTPEMIKGYNTLQIPENKVSIVAENAFANCFVQDHGNGNDEVIFPTIHKIFIPVGVTTIGGNAFKGSNAIAIIDASTHDTEEKMGAFIASIGNNAFAFDSEQKTDGGWIVFNDTFKDTPYEDAAAIQIKTAGGLDNNNWYNDNDDPGEKDKDYFYRDLKNDVVNPETEIDPYRPEAKVFNNRYDAAKEYLTMVNNPNPLVKRFFALDMFYSFSSICYLEQILEYWLLPKLVADWQMRLEDITAVPEASWDDCQRISFMMTNTIRIADDIGSDHFTTYVMSLKYNNFPVYVKRGPIDEHFREDIYIPIDMFQIKFKADLDIDEKKHWEKTPDEIWLENHNDWSVEGYETSDDGVAYHGAIDYSNFSNIAHTYMKNWALFFKCILVDSRYFDLATIQNQ